MFFHNKKKSRKRKVKHKKGKRKKGKKGKESCHHTHSSCEKHKEGNHEGEKADRLSQGESQNRVVEKCAHQVGLAGRGQKEASEHVTDTNTDSGKCDGGQTCEVREGVVVWWWCGRVHTSSNVVQSRHGHLEGARVTHLLWGGVVCGLLLWETQRSCEGSGT